MRGELKAPHIAAAMWLWVLATGLALQWWIIPATPWHAGGGLLAGGDWVQFQQQALELLEQIQRLGWSAWTLRFEGQAPASLAAAMYALTGVTQPWVLLPVHGVLYALAAVVAWDMARLLGVRGRLVWAVLLPFVWPSSLLIYGQMHKDIWSLPGVLLVAWSWLRVLTGDSAGYKHGAAWAAAAAVGIGLIWWARPYQAQLLLGCGVLLWLLSALSAWRRRLPARAWAATGVLLAMLVTYGLAERATQPVQPVQPVQPCETWRPEIQIPGLARPMASLFCFRHGFIQYFAGQSGNIDHDRWLTNYAEAAAYLPRAMQIGLLAPFPSQWMEEASSPGGKVKRWLSGLEMLCVYAVLSGVIVALRHRQATGLIALGLVGVVGILFYVYTSPNVGAIYRYRLPFMMLVWIVGLAGWSASGWVQRPFGGAACKR